MKAMIGVPLVRAPLRRAAHHSFASAKPQPRFRGRRRGRASGPAYLQRFALEELILLNGALRARCQLASHSPNRNDAELAIKETIMARGRAS